MTQRSSESELRALLVKNTSKVEKTPRVDAAWLAEFVALANRTIGAKVEFSVDPENLSYLWVLIVPWWETKENIHQERTRLRFSVTPRVSNKEEFQILADSEMDPMTALFFVVLQVFAAQLQPVDEDDMIAKSSVAKNVPPEIVELLKVRKDLFTIIYRDYNRKLANLHPKLLKNSFKLLDKSSRDLAQIKRDIGIAEASPYDEVYLGQLFRLTDAEKTTEVPRGMPVKSTFNIVYEDLLGNTGESYLIKADEKLFSGFIGIQEQLCVLTEGRTRDKTDDFLQLQLLQAENLIRIGNTEKGMCILIDEEEWRELFEKLTADGIELPADETYTAIKEMFDEMMDAELYFLILRQNTVDKMNGYSEDAAEIDRYRAL